ncbi:hypothetical protein [Kitasatospora sp. NPDC057541]|uniref:hypothetical protein n=1 Tax=Kitasatospora sp. NPDC057541 TaxID=3346161 RepID=UPI003674DF64
MSYFMYDVMGVTVEKPDPAMIERVLDGLTDADDEHPDVSLSHENGWCLSVFTNGLLIWENPDDDVPRPGEMRDVTRDETLRLLGLLAAGDIESIETLPWLR